jgi:hypothetical protein
MNLFSLAGGWLEARRVIDDLLYNPSQELCMGSGEAGKWCSPQTSPLLTSTIILPALILSGHIPIIRGKRV